MFESFGVQGLSLAPTPLLSLYSNGRISGVVIECGHGLSIISPYSDGISVPSATQRCLIGGKILVEYLNRQLRESAIGRLNAHLFQRSKWKSYRAIMALKEEFSQMQCPENKGETESFASHELPDGQTAEIPLKPFARCGEALFEPSVCHLDELGTHDVVYQEHSGFRPREQEGAVRQHSALRGSFDDERAPRSDAS